MSNINDHVTSLELSRQLWEAGVRVDSLHVHAKFWDGLVRAYQIIQNPSGIEELEEANSTLGVYPAYLATELLAVMPRMITVNHYNHYFSLDNFFGDGCRVDYELVRFMSDGNDPKYLIGGSLSDTIPNACAQTLLYLLSNNLITLQEVNGA